MHTYRSGKSGVSLSGETPCPSQIFLCATDNALFHFVFAGPHTSSQASSRLHIVSLTKILLTQPIGSYPYGPSAQLHYSLGKFSRLHKDVFFFLRPSSLSAQSVKLKQRKPPLAQPGHQLSFPTQSKNHHSFSHL